MNATVTIIKNQEDFKNIWKIINNIFDVTQTFPNKVFKKNTQDFLFEEFDWAMTPEFWDTVIKKLSHISKDDDVTVAVLDPDPINYFYKEFKYYNIIKFSANTTGDSYWEALEAGPKDSPADAMLFNSETVVWVPSSAKWGIWGERSYEICVLAFADDSIKQVAQPFLNAWKKADKALNRYISERVPQAFKDSLVKNYLK